MVNCNLLNFYIRSYLWFTFSVYCLSLSFSYLDRLLCQVFSWYKGNFIHRQQRLSPFEQYQSIWISHKQGPIIFIINFSLVWSDSKKPLWGSKTLGLWKNEVEHLTQEQTLVTWCPLSINRNKTFKHLKRCLYFLE